MNRRPIRKLFKRVPSSGIGLDLKQVRILFRVRPKIMALLSESGNDHQVSGTTWGWFRLHYSAKFD